MPLNSGNSKVRLFSGHRTEDATVPVPFWSLSSLCLPGSTPSLPSSYPVKLPHHLGTLTTGCSLLAPSWRRGPAPTDLGLSTRGINVATWATVVAGQLMDCLDLGFGLNYSILTPGMNIGETLLLMDTLLLIAALAMFCW